MTIDEKLQHFYEVSIEEAKEDASQALEEHRQHLAKCWKITNRLRGRMQKHR